MKQYTAYETLIVEFEGDFDAAAAKQHQAAIEALPSTTEKRIAVDFSHVSFLDSSGVGIVVFLFKRLRSTNRELALIGLNGEPERLIKMLRIDKSIPIYADLADYAQATKAAAPIHLHVVHQQ